MPSTAKTKSATPSHIFTKYVGTIKAKPMDQKRLSLGNYSPDQPAKGFSISYNDPEDNSVMTEILTTGSERRYELTLHLTNHSAKNIRVEVWQM